MKKTPHFCCGFQSKLLFFFFSPQELQCLDAFFFFHKHIHLPSRYPLCTVFVCDLDSSGETKQNHLVSQALRCPHAKQRTGGKLPDPTLSTNSLLMPHSPPPPAVPSHLCSQSPNPGAHFDFFFFMKSTPRSVAPFTSCGLDVCRVAS